MLERRAEARLRNAVVVGVDDVAVDDAHVGLDLDLAAAGDDAARLVAVGVVAQEDVAVDCAQVQRWGGRGALGG